MTIAGKKESWKDLGINASKLTTSVMNNSDWIENKKSLFPELQPQIVYQDEIIAQMLKEDFNPRENTVAVMP